MNKSMQLPGIFPVKIVWAALAIALLFPGVAGAKRVAVTHFTGGSSKTLKPTGDKLVADRLEAEGIEVVRGDKYRSAVGEASVAPGAKKDKLTIEAVSTVLHLDAVILAHAAWKPKAQKTSLKVFIFGPTGEKLATNVYTFKGKIKLPAATLEAIWKDIQVVLSDQGVTGAPPPVPSPAPSPAPDPNPIDKKSPPDTLAESPTESIAEQDDNATPSYFAYEAPARSSVGSMSDLLIAAGFGFNLRSGLNPKHASGIFPCVRADLHFFMGTFTDTTFIRDLGFGGSFNMGLGLKYAVSNGGDAWDSSQIQWRAELLYRLALLDHTTLKPAFVLRGGYGATIATIDAPVTVGEVRSASYSAPFAGLDIYLMLADPVLRLRLGGGAVFAVAAGEELNADAWGFYVDAGVDIVIVKWLHTSLGWEMTRYSLQDIGTSAAPAMGSTNDLFNYFYVRLGFSFDGK